MNTGTRCAGLGHMHCRGGVEAAIFQVFLDGIKGHALRGKSSDAKQVFKMRGKVVCAASFPFGTVQQAFLDVETNRASRQPSDTNQILNLVNNIRHTVSPGLHYMTQIVRITTVA